MPHYAEVVNKAHLEFCASAEWGRLVEDELLPWVLAPAGLLIGSDGLDTPARRSLARVTPSRGRRYL
jgi:hypothetical protein